MTTTYKSTKRLLSQIKTIKKSFEQLGLTETQAKNKLMNLTFDTDFYDVTAVNDNVSYAFDSAISSDVGYGLDDLVFYLEGTLEMLENDMAF